jgi:hypothetical protein
LAPSQEDAFNRCTAQRGSVITEREEAKREGLMEARVVVERYQNANWRRLRVNDICDDIKRLIDEEAERAAEARQSPTIS